MAKNRDERKGAAVVGALPAGNGGAAEELLTTVEAAALLRRSPRTLEGLRIRGGGPPFCKIGGSVHYRRSTLLRLIADSERTSTSDSGPQRAA